MLIDFLKKCFCKQTIRFHLFLPQLEIRSQTQDFRVPLLLSPIHVSTGLVFERPAPNDWKLHSIRAWRIEPEVCPRNGALWCCSHVLQTIYSMWLWRIANDACVHSLEPCNLELKKTHGRKHARQALQWLQECTELLVRVGGTIM